MTAAAQAVRSPALRARVAGLPEGERALLYRITELSVAGADMIGGAVFEEVQDYLPVGKTTYHEHLNGESIFTGV